MQRRLIIAAVTCAVLTLGAIGCSSDDAPGPGAEAENSTTAPATSDPAANEEVDGAAEDGDGSETVDTDPASVPAVQPQRLDPVDVGEPNDLGVGLFVQVTTVETIDVVGEGPGATSGPALAVTVELENRTAEAVDLSAVVVNATGPTGEVGVPVTAGGASPANGDLEPGETVEADYLFRFDEERDGAVVDVEYGGADHVVVVQT